MINLNMILALAKTRNKTDFIKEMDKQDIPEEEAVFWFDTNQEMANDPEVFTKAA